MPGVRNADRVIIGAIVLTLPSIEQAFSSGISPASCLVRFIFALLLCWGFGAIIERLFDTYSRQARQSELAQRLQQIAAARAALVTQQSAGSDSRGGANGLPGNDALR